MTKTDLGLEKDPGLGTQGLFVKTDKSGHMRYNVLIMLLAQ